MGKRVRLLVQLFRHDGCIVSCMTNEVNGPALRIFRFLLPSKLEKLWITRILRTFGYEYIVRKRDAKTSPPINHKKSTRGNASRNKGISVIKIRLRRIRVEKMVSENEMNFILVA